jgi:hypothetical protein
MEIVIILLVTFVFEIAASRWGFKSSDGLNSSEWERRQNWRAFHSCRLQHE